MHNGFSVRHEDRRGTLHTISYLQCDEFDIAEIEALLLSQIEMWGAFHV